MHGMPIGFLAGLVNKVQDLPGFNWFKPCLSPKDIVYIGTRTLNEGEKVAIKKLGIKTFTVS
jgi:arginase